jgi:hypothetical protein
MIVEQRCSAIVMLTEVTEGKAQKCCPYFPQNVGDHIVVRSPSKFVGRWAEYHLHKANAQGCWPDAIFHGFGREWGIAAHWAETTAHSDPAPLVLRQFLPVVQ